MTIEIKTWRCSNTAIPKLTIGIPTWNRCAVLADQLSRLSAHLNEDIEVLVIDNRSDDQTWDQLSNWASTVSGCSVTLLRNGVNLGADENYLRIFEAASGEWVWLLGDDDHINFKILPKLVGVSAESETSVVLVIDENEATELLFSTPFLRLAPETFFRPEIDVLGLLFQQVGRVLCRTHAARMLLRQAHAEAVGMLHAYSFIYGSLVENQGITVTRVELRTSPQSNSIPRWNLLAGHVGAWRSAVISFKKHVCLASAREVRLRERTLLMIVLREAVNERIVSCEQIRWMIRVFSMRGRITLLALQIALRVSRVLTVRILNLLLPAKMARLIDRESSSHTGY